MGFVVVQFDGFAEVLLLVEVVAGPEVTIGGWVDVVVVVTDEAVVVGLAAVSSRKYSAALSPGSANGFGNFLISLEISISSSPIIVLSL